MPATPPLTKPAVSVADKLQPEKKNSILDFLEFASPTREQKTALLAMANFVTKTNL